MLTLSIRLSPSRRGLVLALGVGLSLASPWQSHASQVASIKLDADDLTPIVLDQNGARVPMPTKHSGPVTLPAGTVPSYVAYTVDSDDSVPQGFPAVYTGAAKAGRTTGPLRLDAVVQGKLDQDLAQYGKVAVHTPNGTYLVKPLAPVFGSNGAGGSSTGRAWVATTQAAALKSHALDRRPGRQHASPGPDPASDEVYGPDQLRAELRRSGPAEPVPPPVGQVHEYQLAGPGSPEAGHRAQPAQERGDPPGGSASHQDRGADAGSGSEYAREPPSPHRSPNPARWPSSAWSWAPGASGTA